MTQWPGIVADSSPIDSRPGIAAFQQNTRTRVLGELRRRRGMARSSLDKFSAAATGQASTNNNVGPFTVFQVGSTLEGLASGYALWGDAQLLRPSGFATYSGGIYDITVNRLGDTTARAYVILAKSGNYPVSYEDGTVIDTLSATPTDSSLSTTWTATSAGTWYFAAFGVADGQCSPLGTIPVLTLPVTTVSTLTPPASATIYFGLDVKPYNNIIAVGDPGDASGGGSGAVHLYNSSHALIDTLAAANIESFGTAICWASSTMFYASSFFQTHSGYASAGALSAYSWDGTTATKVEEMFAVSTAYVNRQLGHGLACTDGGSILYAGAPYPIGLPGRLFIMRGTPTSHDDGTVFYPSRSSNTDQCGRRVTVSGNGAVLALNASSGLSSGGNATGLVFLYDIGLSGVLQNEFIAEPTGADDAGGTSNFGLWEVGLSDDATKLAIGASNFVYYYERRGGVWTRVGRIDVPASSYVSTFISNNGAFLVIANASTTWVYETGSLTLLSTIAMAGDRRVALNGTTVIAVNDANGVYKYTT